MKIMARFVLVVLGFFLFLLTLLSFFILLTTNVDSLSVVFVLAIISAGWFVLVKFWKKTSLKNELTDSLSVEPKNDVAIERNKETSDVEEIIKEFNYSDYKNRVKIVYRDYEGMITERVVIPIEIEDLDNGRSRMHSFCLLKNAHRTFYVDGIIECIDCETGELVSDVLSFLKSKAESK